MKWGFGIRQKLTLSTILVVVFTITFLNNIASSNNVNELGSSFSSVYKDRLLVESYIYRLSEILHQKRIMTYSPDQPPATWSGQIAQQNSEIAQLLAAYDKTKLTAEEILFFKKLKHSFAQISAQEQSQQAQEAVLQEMHLPLQKELDNAAGHLRALSSIQLAEAGNLNESSRKIVAGSALTNEMGSAIFIFSLLIVNVLIFSSRLTKQVPSVTNPQLN